MTMWKVTASMWLLVQLALVHGLDVSRPNWFSRDALNFAREEGTGFMYTTGHFKGTTVLAYKDVCNYETCFQVPSVKMQSNGPSDIFLAKYNPRNQLVWAKKAGGDGADIAESVVLSNVRSPDDDAHRDVYITGTIQGKAWFDTTKTVSALSSKQKSIFVTKYNTSDGSVRWAKLAATCGTTDVHSDLGERIAFKDPYSHCSSRAIGVDGNGDVVIAGKFFGTLNFDDGVRLMSGTQCRVRAGTGRVCEHSVFVAKIRRDTGAFVWADTVSDPVHIKTKSAGVKQEWSDWAGRTIELFHRLDDVDYERVDDSWPLGVDGLNSNLYKTSSV